MPNDDIDFGQGSQRGDLHTVLAEEEGNEFKRTQLLWQLAS